ncbi:MAG: hypothetical protein C4582_09015 [Desulfobacteraceae bacterium]|nr:MAG: hypothetical protein C4582_09015 [Desulfobacteraceae bacterium]
MENTIKFKYIFSKDYNPKYVNGAYGGVTPKGEITINFYFERQGLPTSQEYEITNDGRFSNEIKTEPEDLQKSMIRFVDTGVILNLTTAKAIISWLSAKVEFLEEKIQKESKPID